MPTGALAGSDAVYDAAFRRAGLLRVRDLDELFAAAETLGRLAAFAGRRLAILTNGGGIGVLAVDRLADFDGEFADISPETMTRLDAVMPPIWSHANPVDIAGDADAARYAAVIERSSTTRQRRRPGHERADRVRFVARRREAIVGVTKHHREKRSPAKPVLAVWIGGSAASTRRSMRRAFRATRRGRCGHRLHAPGALSLLRVAVDGGAAEPAGRFRSGYGVGSRLIAAALRDGRHWLDPIEVARMFAAYGIAVTPAISLAMPDEAVAAGPAPISPPATPSC